MKKAVQLILVLLVGIQYAKAQDAGTPKTGNSSTASASSGLEGLMSYNFVNNNASITNLTPVVYYSWTKSYNFKGNFGGTFEVGPYTSSQIDVSKSQTYVPGLMTSGNFGLIINHYFTLKFGDNKFYISPINVGLKILPGFSDSSKTLIQTNIRPSLTYQYSSLFAVTCQFTDAWHNISSDSQKNFEYIFGNQNTNVSYLTVTLQTRVSSSTSVTTKTLPTYFVIQWRDFLTNNSAFNSLSNRRFLTFGFKVGLDIKTGTSAIE
jgi:hypothetical protein